MPNFHKAIFDILDADEEYIANSEQAKKVS